jgi:hypothetical protein
MDSRRDAESSDADLDVIRHDLHSMVEMFKTLWDEVDAQFEGFERGEKLQVFSYILQTMASSTMDEGMPLEELMEAVKLAGKTSKKSKR